LYRYEANNPIVRIDPSGFVSCGPDVTDWFSKEIDLFRTAAKELVDRYLTPGKMGYSEAPALDSLAGLAFGFQRLGRLADYKHRTKKNVEPFDYSKCDDPDKDTVTLCGVCIGTNQLGNIIFGITAVNALMEKDAREFGLGTSKVSKGPDVLWSAPGEGYRQLAFELGVDFEKWFKRTGKADLCVMVREREKNLNGAKLNTNACNKEPCKDKHTGPNTDMKRDPISDPRGN
jgi:hypothetical protein